MPAYRIARVLAEGNRPPALRLLMSELSALQALPGGDGAEDLRAGGERGPARRGGDDGLRGRDDDLGDPVRDEMTDPAVQDVG